MKELLVGKKWVVRYRTQEINLPLWAIERGAEVLQSWQEVFPKEDNWAQKNFGVPSLITRIEGTMHGESLSLFEVEERPAGIGVNTKISSEFRLRLEGLKREWPRFKALISCARQGAGDDYLWIETVNPEDVRASDALLVRAEPEESEFWKFESQSVSSIRFKGDKSYGQDLGWWHRVSNPDQLNWEKGFVLKPIQSSKARGIEIWDPFQKRNGSSTKSRICRSLERFGTMYCQDLIEPNISPCGTNMIYRIFYGYSPSQRRWVCLGGVYNVRPNLRIHGASDGYFGPLSLDN